MTGHCTPGCGACCRVLAIPFEDYKEDVVDFLDGTYIHIGRMRKDYRNFLKLHEGEDFEVTSHGVWVDNNIKKRRGTYSGAPVVYVYQPCSALGENGMCSLYGKPERPKLCGKWPTDKDDLWIVRDQCTYSANP